MCAAPEVISTAVRLWALSFSSPRRGISTIPLFGTSPPKDSLRSTRSDSVPCLSALPFPFSHHDSRPRRISPPISLIHIADFVLPWNRKYKLTSSRADQFVTQRPDLWRTTSFRRINKFKQLSLEIDKTGGCIVCCIHMRRDLFSPLRLFGTNRLPTLGGKCF